MVLTLVFLGGAVAMLVFGLIWAWRNRPVRGPDDWDEGELTYLQGFNITNSRDFGLYRRPRGDDDD